MKGDEAVDAFKNLSEELFNDIFEGVPQGEVALNEFNDGIDIVALLAEKSGFLASNGEARRALKENSVSVNRAKVEQDTILTKSDLIAGKYLLLQRGKKNNFVVKAI